MIVKNEEQTLARCLKSCEGLFDEIIIVDTGSIDNTKKIAEELGAKVYDFEWSDDFSKARNFAFSKAETDYIMWLDADDVLPDDTRSRLKKKLKGLSGADIIMMKYHTAFDERLNPIFSFYRERIIKANGNFKWEGRVHEAITPKGTIEYWDECVHHKKLKQTEKSRNLKIYQKMLAEGAEFSPRDKYYYARELSENGLYEKAITAYEDFLEQGNAFCENLISACRDLSRCFLRLNMPDSSKKALFYSFMFDTPRAEICCDIGKCFLDAGKYREAVFWYSLALTIPMNLTSGGFIESDYYGYIPALQLCVCYDRLSNPEKAFEMNALAKTFKPSDPSVLYNDAYFKKKYNMD